MAKPLTIQRYDGSTNGWEDLYPITLGANVYGSGTQATTPLLDSNDKINADFIPLTIKVDSVNARTSSSSTTYGVGTSGQVLKSNGTNAYWGSDSSDNTSQAIGANYKWKNQIAGYQIFITDIDNKLVPMVTGASGSASTGTSKTMNTQAFDPFGLIGYTSSSSYRAADALCSGSTFTAYSSLDLRYSFNCGSNLTANAPVYIVAVLDTNGDTAHLTSPYYSQTLPSTADGKIYIYLGQAISTTNINLQEGHPVYQYVDGAIRLYTRNDIATIAPTIILTSTQIVSQSPLVLSLTSAQQGIIEDLNNTIIKIDISAFYTAIGLDSPYAWIKRNAIKNIGDTTNGAVLYEFICNNNDIDASASLTKLGNIGIYYFYQTVGTYTTYNKAIIISSAKITLSNLSHATNLQNSTGSGSLLQVPITSTFTFSNAGSGQSGTKNTAATAVDATSLGGISLASGDSSLASGKNNIAAGWGSAAFGSNTYSGGNMTFTEGEQTTATGSNAHAAGQGTIASGGNQFVIGRWNYAESGSLFIVGNGSSNSSRTNAFSVSQEGYIKCVGLTDGTTQKTMTQVLAGGGSTDIPVTSASGSSQQLARNTFYDFGDRGTISGETITITLGSATSGVVNEYMGEILVDEYPITLSTPSIITWAESDGVTNASNALTLEEKYTYQFNIVRNLGLIVRFPNGVLAKPSPIISGSTISWSAITNATNYKVESGFYGGDTTAHSTTTTSTSYDLLNWYPTLGTLSTPTNLNASSTSSSITLTWDSVANASGYTVYYKTSSQSAYTSTTVLTNTATINNLSSGTTYNLYVKTNPISHLVTTTVTAQSTHYVNNTSSSVSYQYIEYNESANSSVINCNTTS